MSDAKMFDALSSHIDERIREVARHDARMERLPNLGGVIREIVREEMAKSTIGPIPGRSLYDSPAPKPKTDLERAAEIADNQAARKDISRPGALNHFADGYVAGAREIYRQIRSLPPSPDWEAKATLWRRIAEGLYGAVVQSENAKYPYLWTKVSREAIAAYDAAVKETSLAEGARSKEADK